MGYKHNGLCNKNLNEYNSWYKMITRCTDKNYFRYKDHGGRGITVCERWLNSFENFLNDMGKKPSKEYSLERVNNEKGYYPNNCKWATKVEQARNKRKYKNNTTGYKGVYLIKGKYVAKIGVNGKLIYLGVFEDINDAIKVRKQAEVKYWRNKSANGKVKI